MHFITGSTGAHVCPEGAKQGNPGRRKPTLFVNSGKLLPAGLTIDQIVALRFAPDAEFTALVDKAISENMAPKAIKQAIPNWKGDYFRV